MTDFDLISFELKVETSSAARLGRLSYAEKAIVHFLSNRRLQTHHGLYIS